MVFNINLSRLKRRRPADSSWLQYPLLAIGPHSISNSKCGIGNLIHHHNHNVHFNHIVSNCLPLSIRWFKIIKESLPGSFYTFMLLLWVFLVTDIHKFSFAFQRSFWFISLSVSYRPVSTKKWSLFGSTSFFDYWSIRVHWV